MNVATATIVNTQEVVCVIALLVGILGVGFFVLLRKH